MHCIFNCLNLRYIRLYFDLNKAEVNNYLVVVEFQLTLTPLFSITHLPGRYIAYSEQRNNPSQKTLKSLIHGGSTVYVLHAMHRMETCRIRSCTVYSTALTIDILVLTWMCRIKPQQIINNGENNLAVINTHVYVPFSNLFCLCFTFSN